MKNNIFYINCTSTIPEVEENAQFHKNAWISPEGKFYGFEGAKHIYCATYIGIFLLGGDENSLKKGTYFNEGWDTWIMKKGWCSVKNLSWLGKSRPSTFSFGGAMTEKQKTVLFDYCEKFGYDWEEMIRE